MEDTVALKSTSGTIFNTCTAGTVNGFTSNTGSSTETVSGAIDELTWGSAGTACTKTTDTKSNGELKISWPSGSNGAVTGKNSRVTVLTIFGTCTYGFGLGFGINLGTIKGGNPATVSINTLIPKVSGNFACPSEARWTANYRVTSPWPLYVVTA